jgi:hypothetical protein
LSPFVSSALPFTRLGFDPKLISLTVWHFSLQNLEKSEKEESLPPAEEPECLSEVSEQVPLPITIPDVNAASEF